jgi:cell division protein FtsI/penicillin-binding protein 2
VARPWGPPARGAWGSAKRKRRPARESIDRNFIRAATLRAKLLFYSFALMAGFLLVHLYLIQIHDGKALAARALDQRLETRPLVARRGTIFDRDGNTLVRSLPSQSIYVTPREVQDKPAIAHTLGVLLGTSSERILAKLRSHDGFVLIGRKIDRDVAERISKSDLTGVSIVAEDTGVRYSPSPRLASTVLGFTGIDENGLDGIEYAFDEQLRGRPGSMSLEADQSGRALPFSAPHVIAAAHPGYGLLLTLDSYMQYNVERILRETVRKWNATSGSAIVMDPWTGEVLALANAPDYDVSRYDSFPADSRRDRAVMDAYEPGSTFKLITAAAALDSGKVTVTDRFPARDKIEVGGRTIHNAEDGFLAGTGSSETLEDIVAYSHNVGAAEVGLSIGRQTMYATMRRFGFGDVTGIGLPGESPGIVPTLDLWSESSLPTIAFGHGIATTPLALARAYSAIANGGLLLRPSLLDAVLMPDGGAAYRYGRQVERRAISARTAAILQRYLRAVVTRGTGNPNAQVAGYTTAGKTGTAQIAEHGRYVPGEYVASFVGYVPAEHPRFVILVKIERPRGAIYGSEVAAPAFSAIAAMAMLHAGVLPATPRLVKPVPAPKHHP